MTSCSMLRWVSPTFVDGSNSTDTTDSTKNSQSFCEGTGGGGGRHPAAIQCSFLLTLLGDKLHAPEGR